MLKAKSDLDLDCIDIDIPEDLFENGLPNTYLFKYYNDLSERKIWINEEITNDHLYEIAHYILYWNKQDKDLRDIDRKPIYLMFNSPGGSIDVYAAVCSIIELSITPVIGVAVGMVASAASLIYLSCHCRLALKSSYFILHKGSAVLNGDFDNLMNSIDDYKKEVDKMVKHILEHSNYTQEEIESHIGKDWYIRADTALEKGLVDEIVTNINTLL